MGSSGKRFMSNNAQIPSFKNAWQTWQGVWPFGLTANYSATCGHSGTKGFGDLLTSSFHMCISFDNSQLSSLHVWSGWF